jgi:putative ABC transport system substrate-binding protein
MTMWFRAGRCILTLTLSLLTALLAAEAQTAEKIPRIGVLMQGTPPGEAGDELDVLRQGLRDLGDVEGQTIALEVRWGKWQPERHLALATDLVQQPVDVIVAAGATPTRAAQQATTTIPIVMLVGIAPVAQGLVASLARPGGTSPD